MLQDARDFAALQSWADRFWTSVPPTPWTQEVLQIVSENTLALAVAWKKVVDEHNKTWDLGKVSSTTAVWV